MSARETETERERERAFVCVRPKRLPGLSGGATRRTYMRTITEIFHSFAPPESLHPKP